MPSYGLPDVISIDIDAEQFMRAIKSLEIDAERQAAIQLERDARNAEHWNEDRLPPSKMAQKREQYKVQTDSWAVSCYLRESMGEDIIKMYADHLKVKAKLDNLSSMGVESVGPPATLKSQTGTYYEF